MLHANAVDCESDPAAEQMDDEGSRLRIAIVGFGNFGQFLGRTFAAQGHTVLAHSRSDHSSAAASIGAEFFRCADDLCESQPDVLLLATSILSTADVVRSLPLHRLRRSTLVADVLSVKEYPKALLTALLPRDLDIVCTHPMFGPESGRHGWSGLTFVYDKVRVGDSPERAARCQSFLNIFAREGCRMVEMSCAEHDAHAAESQLLTHAVGRTLAELDLRQTPISTAGYRSLLELRDNTCKDSFDLFNGLFMFNKNATGVIDRLVDALLKVRSDLYGNLHHVARSQLFEGALHAPPRSVPPPAGNEEDGDGKKISTNDTHNLEEESANEENVA